MIYIVELHANREKNPKCRLKSLTSIKTRNSISGNMSYSHTNPNIKIFEMMEKSEFGEKLRQT